MPILYNTFESEGLSKPDSVIIFNKIIPQVGIIKLKAIFFEKDQQDTRVKHIFLNDKGEKIFEEVFLIQKKRIYNALLNSNPDQVLNFDNVLKKIINE